MSLRFLACLLQHDDKDSDSLFHKLINEYTDILDFILENAFSEEGLTRYSCIEVLQQIVTYKEGSNW